MVFWHQIGTKLIMENRKYKESNRINIRYPAEVCRRIFFYSVLKGLSVQKIHIKALEFWLDHEDAKRLEARERFTFLDND